jgi:hypothetical protein
MPIRKRPATKASKSSPTPSVDLVNHPPHYTQGGIECIDAIRASMSKEQFLGYCKGNSLKYQWRYEAKGGVEDLKKAKWYLDRMIQEIQG